MGNAIAPGGRPDIVIGTGIVPGGNAAKGIATGTCTGTAPTGNCDNIGIGGPKGVLRIVVPPGVGAINGCLRAAAFDDAALAAAIFANSAAFFIFSFSFSFCNRLSAFSFSRFSFSFLSFSFSRSDLIVSNLSCSNFSRSFSFSFIIFAVAIALLSLLLLGVDPVDVAGTGGLGGLVLTAGVVGLAVARVELAGVTGLALEGVAGFSTGLVLAGVAGFSTGLVLAAGVAGLTAAGVAEEEEEAGTGFVAVEDVPL